MMMPWMQHCLMAGLLGGTAALLAWGLCAVLAGPGPPAGCSAWSGWRWGCGLHCRAG